MTSTKEIAVLLGAPVRGKERAVARVSAIDSADGEAVVFATDEQTVANALASRAGVVLVNAALQSMFVPGLEDDRIMWVQDARYAFALVARRLAPDEAGGEVHPSAVLGNDVRVGTGTRIGPGVVIGDDVVIGESCSIGARVVIHTHTGMGDRVIVQAGAVLGSTGFGYVRNADTGEYLRFPQQGRLVIESDVEIGANTTIDRGALGETRIGQGSKLDNLVHVGHNVRIGRNVIIAAQTGISGSSVIHDAAVIAGQVGIAEHVTIGPGVVLGAKCGVPTGKQLRGPGEVFWGIPARPIREYLRDLAKLRRS